MTDARRPVVLLASQAFALGVVTAWVLVAATATFLDDYGSRLLPVTYLGAAGAGAASTAALRVALRRRSLSALAARVLAVFAVALVSAWALLVAWSASWVAFGLLVVVPIIVPVGFMFVVGQAGALLDVLALKAGYGRVIAGFATGFAGGGLVAPVLLGVLGRTEHLLVAAAAATGGFLALVLATRRSFPAELSRIDDEPGGERLTLAVVLRDRYVRLIVAFQLLSAIESQWLDFLVYDRAADRYSGDDLAVFISRFMAFTYGLDILVLVVASGFLLRRFGLRYGLTANSLGVLTLVVSLMAATALSGSGSTIAFLLVVGSRATDLVLSDAAARASLSAAYQVVPERLRLTAQAMVEGLAVPVAIGCSGAVLLVIGPSGVGILPGLTAVVVVLWVAVAVLLYLAYRTNLLTGLRHRVLDPTALTSEDVDPLVIERLFASDEERDIRLGLGLLVSTAHPDLGHRLRVLASDGRVRIRAEALDRLLSIDPGAAADAARPGLDDPDPTVRALCTRILGAAATEADRATIAARWSDPSTDVRIAVAGAAMRIRDDALRSKVADEIDRLRTSEDMGDRTTAARLLGALEGRHDDRRAALAALLTDPEPGVRVSAIDALRWPEDVDLLDHVLEAVHDRSTAGAAVAALTASGADALASIDAALDDPSLSFRGHHQLVRACREIGGDGGLAVLRRHAAHHQREVGLAAMSAIGALVAAAPDDAATGPAVTVSDDLERAALLLHALLALDGASAASVLDTALRHELELATERVLAALSTRYGATAIAKVAFQFAQHDTRSHALALEWLEVTLDGVDRVAIALIEPGLSHAQRSQRLDRALGAGPKPLDEILLDLVEDRDGRWRRPWLSACALYFAAAAPGDIGSRAVRAAEARCQAGHSGPPDILGETLTGLRRRRSRGLRA